MSIEFRADPPTLEEHLLYQSGRAGSVDAVITLMVKRAVGAVTRDHILQMDYYEADEARERCFALMNLGSWSAALMRRSPDNEQADMTYAEAQAMIEGGGNGMDEEDALWGA